MNRESKLALLKGIQEGVLTKEHLHNSNIYIFMGEINDSISEKNEKRFSMGGKVYSDEERLEFINRIERKNLELKKLGIFENSTEFKDTHITIIFE